MRGLVLGLSMTRRGGSSFSPLSLSPQAWYDPSDLSTMFQTGTRASPGAAVTADGDPVGLILDKSGNNNDLVQGTAGQRPLYKTSGGLSWLLFDGVDDRLNAAFVVAQPWDRVSAIQQVTWTSGEHIFGGSSSNNGVLFQFSATPNLCMFSGSAGPQSTGLAVATNGVVTERHNGASSKLAIDNGAYATGDTGAGVPGGVTIADQNSSGANSNIRLYGMLMGAFSDAGIAQLRTYLGAKQGRVL